MSDGLVRQVEPSQPQPHSYTIDVTLFSPQNLAMSDFYHYFQLTPNLSPTEDIERVNKVYELLDGKTPGDKMLSLRQVNEYLGRPNQDE